MPENEQILQLSGKGTEAILEVIGGFPRTCRDLTIVGELDSSKLQPDASLFVGHQYIPAEEFCVERVRVGTSLNPLPIKVFACSEHAKG